jgi:hypothetical protein
MDVANQDALANSILLLFLSILFVGGILFASRLGYKATSARWPHAKTAWSLLAISATGVMLSVNLMSLRPGVANWLSWVSVVGVQIGIVILMTTISWLGLLSLLYPLNPSLPAGTRHITRKDIVGEAFFIALTIGYAASTSIFWRSGLLVATGVGVAVALLAFLIAFWVLNRTLRR